MLHVTQKQFEEMLKEFRNAVLGYQRVKLRQEIFAARQKDEKILIWVNQAASMPTVELAYVEFHDDSKLLRSLGLESADDSCSRMVRFTLTEGGFIPLKDVCRTDYVSPEAFVAEYEEVHPLNLIDVSLEDEALWFVKAGKFPGFKWFWDIVTTPRDITIKYTETLVSFTHIKGHYLVEDALKEDEKGVASGEIENSGSDMEVADSSTDAVSAKVMENNVQDAV